MRRRSFVPFLRLWWTVCAVAALALLPGCSKSGPSGNVQASAFDSAPADVKQLWNDAMSSWKAHHFAQAADKFVAVKGRSGELSAPQVEALTRAIDEFGSETFKAANNGDAEATKAVLALKGSGRR
jgi:hypothetical protein